MPSTLKSISNRNDDQSKARQTPVGIHIFQPVLKAYPTQHSWIITANISIGELNKQLHMFNHQKALAHELLMKL